MTSPRTLPAAYSASTEHAGQNQRGVLAEMDLTFGGFMA